MTYGEFKQIVLELLTTDADRIGLESFIDRQIRAALIDLQIKIPTYQINKTTRFAYDELLDDGYIAYGTLPEGASAKEFWIIPSDSNEDADKDDRAQLNKESWAAREAVRRFGQAEYGGCYGIGPDRKDFFICPKINANWLLKVNWDGVQRTFDEDTVMYAIPEKCSQAVYYWVKGRILLDQDNDRPGGLLFFNNDQNRPGDYQVERTNLWLEANKR